MDNYIELRTGTICYTKTEKEHVAMGLAARKIIEDMNYSLVEKEDRDDFNKFMQFLPDEDAGNTHMENHFYGYKGLETIRRCRDDLDVVAVDEYILLSDENGFFMNFLLDEVEDLIGALSRALKLAQKEG